MTEEMDRKTEEEVIREEQTQTPDETQATAEQENQPAEEERELTTEEKLEQANEKIAELEDSLLRKIAEFDNYRKRTLKEKTELILNGGEKTVTAILPVLDDMERALKNMQKADNVAAVAEGVELIYKKFTDILSRQGVEAIATEQADFDVDLHEAIAQLPAPTDEMKGKVMDCTLRGYKMNDKVIRHAQVVVGV